MDCPKCGCGTYVVDSRQKPYRVYRRRECRVCGHRFSTSEMNEAHIRKLLDDFVDSFREKVETSIGDIKSEIYDSLGIKERMQDDETENSG
jgi:transcriptional regulator NrdR family protein